MSPLDPAQLAKAIRALQQPCGAIPWVETGVWDPWNQTEAAMGLAAAGAVSAARAAYAQLAASQEPDGGWTADMGCAAAMSEDGARIRAETAPRVRDPNFNAYPAVGVWHLYLTTGAVTDLARFGPMAMKGARFAARWQRADGAVPWAISPDGRAEQTASAPACAAIHLSLACAAAIAERLGRDASDLRAAQHRLALALDDPSGPGWDDASRFAMDWYYPVLAGVTAPDEAAARLDSRWDTFVDPDWGCRCVIEEPWATAAETSELAIACAVAGRPDAGRALLDAAARGCWADGKLWMGRQFTLDRVWPEEAPSWTAGAALLALEALNLSGLNGAGAAVFLDPPLAPHTIRVKKTKVAT